MPLNCAWINQKHFFAPSQWKVAWGVEELPSQKPTASGWIRLGRNFCTRPSQLGHTNRPVLNMNLHRPWVTRNRHAYQIVCRLPLKWYGTLKWFLHIELFTKQWLVWLVCFVLLIRFGWPLSCPVNCPGCFDVFFVCRWGQSDHSQPLWPLWASLAGQGKMPQHRNGRGNGESGSGCGGCNGWGRHHPKTIYEVIDQ